MHAALNKKRRPESSSSLQECSDRMWCMDRIASVLLVHKSTRMWFLLSQNLRSPIPIGKKRAKRSQFHWVHDTASAGSSFYIAWRTYQRASSSIKLVLIITNAALKE